MRLPSLPSLLHTQLSHFSLFYHSNNIWCGVHIINLLIMYSSPLPRYFYHLGLNISFSTLFSNALSLCFPHNVTDQVSHPYTTWKFVALYTLVFIFSDSKMEDKIFLTEWYQALPEFNLIFIFFMNAIFICLSKAVNHTDLIFDTYFSILFMKWRDFFFPVALQPYRVLADRAAAAGQRS